MGLNDKVSRGTPLYGRYRHVRSQKVGLSAVLVLNRVSTLAILLINEVWFLHSGHKISWVCFLEEANLQDIDIVGEIADFWS